MALKKKLVKKSDKPVEKKQSRLQKKTPTALQRNKQIVGDPKKQLSGIIDYNRPFSIFYSGVEYRRYFDGCHAEGVENFLMSFEYLSSKGAKDMHYYHELGIKMFVDSGAFTYITNPEYRDMSIEYWEIHIEKYLNWARKHKDIIFAIANLDLEMLVGTDQVWEWNKKYFEPFMMETGIPVCFIWHGVSGIEHWEKMCERYPYVGFSMASEQTGRADVAECMNRLAIAEEYGALVHGMGMTSIDMLTKLPFYTVDSTTWKSGLRYGMYVTWTGTSVKQFPKADWDEKVIPNFKKYNKQFDMDLLFEYDEPEVVKASVYAFQCAEKYLREVLEPFTYWHKPKALIQRIDPDLFPTPDWFEDAVYIGLDDYARRLNINPEARKALDIVVDCTLFCMWENEDYAILKKVICDQYDEGQFGFISESYDKYLNKICFDEETMLEELQKFFKDCVRGDNDRLLLMETPYSKIRKEREVYVDSQDKEVVHLNEGEVLEKIKETGLLTDGEATFSEELDQEIFANTGIVLARNEKGQFTGGKMTVSTKKTLLGNTPKIMCDNCIERNSCPEFKRGFVCAFDKVFSKFDTRNPQDVADALYEMANVSVSRLQRALVQENLDGGMITGTVSNLIDQNLRILGDLKKMEKDGTLEVLKRTIVRRPDGTIEEEQSIQNPQAGGILAQLFSQNASRPNTDLADELSDQDLEDIEEAVVEAKTSED